MIKKSATLWVAGTICVLLFASSILLPAWYLDFFKNLTHLSLDTFGDFYLYFGFGITCLLVLLAVLPSGKVYLGKTKPKYPFYAWVAMLFSTGMGPGMMLRAVQEPVFYFDNPPNELGYEPVSYALAYTFFHWGFTPWALYGLFGLIMAYFIYLRGRKLLPSAVFETNSIGSIAINSFIIICTIVGVISSVGLGSKQLLGGINFLAATNFQPNIAIVILLVITAISIYSARSGLSKSIKLISTLNMTMMLLLLLFVLTQSNLQVFAKNFIDAFWIYVKDFAGMSLNTGKYQVTKAFLMDWTYFYWAFWLAWVPFTGVFIARISRGRTIREFILGTLIAPSIGTFFWFAAFGSYAMHGDQDGLALSEKFGSIYSAIFIFFEGMPISSITNGLSLLLIFTFLITSIDSAIFVLSMFSDQGKEKPSKTHRMIWGIALGALTSGLIYAGQDTLLEATSFVLITFALPFSLLYLLFIVVFLRDIIRSFSRNEFNP